MEAISTLDIFKIGVGPSSSHTMGPWKAALAFLECLPSTTDHVAIHLYGSLAKTGKGHGTDIAVQLGLQGYRPRTFDTQTLNSVIAKVAADGSLLLDGKKRIEFDPRVDIVFHRDVSLPEHPNGLTFVATGPGQNAFSKTYFSIGGGFISERGADSGADCANVDLPHYFSHANELAEICQGTGLKIYEVALLNEDALRPRQETLEKVDLVARTMLECVYEGCHTVGTLPGGLGVTRRAAEMNRALLGAECDLPIDQWVEAVKAHGSDFDSVSRWLSCFALAVNEVNAAFGRVVTAPTNGAAGVVPAVLLFHQLFGKSSPESLREFLLTSAQIAIIFKKNATISAAMGGCQAEIGVSSAMAAAGLTAVKGGRVEHCLMAAEIAMEHHLGMTCDPIGGLVQIPCIERNSMGAIKAVTASNLALDSDPEKAKVSLDDVVSTMWQTALDMNTKYKETSEGGLAVRIPVNLPEC